MNLSEVASELETAFGERSERDAPLGELTTYRVGGRASIRVHDEIKKMFLSLKLKKLQKNVLFVYLGLIF